MVIDYDIRPFLVWLLPSQYGVGAIVSLILLLAIGILLAFLFSYVMAAIRHGPGEGFYVVAQVVAGAIPDFVKTSPRRVLAMARLAIKESIRGRVLVVFIVFLVVLLYARWFLDVKSDHPGRLYLSFVLTATNYLVLLLALFLSTFSLPNDIKNRTIYTVVTKPVRAGEIVLGRVLGFTAIGTVVLVIMGLVSYLFVIRGLDHRHELDAAPAEISQGLEESGSWTGTTTLNAHHRHPITLDREGEATTDMALEHYHVVQRDGDQVALSSPRGHLQARVPVYGDLQFLNRSGGPGGGVNVGHEWSYRQYIEGKTQAAAIWTFAGVSEEQFPDGLPLELTLRVFRTHMGDIERGVQGSITVKNPNESARIRSSAAMPFVSKEFATDTQFIKRKLAAISADGSRISEVDLFEDLVHEGEVEIWVKCEDAGQYLGMAKADLYLRAANRTFWLNFVKGYVGIWLQMAMVTSFGVMFSTFLSGAVAMMATLSSIVLGKFTQFIIDVFGGVIEANQLLQRVIGRAPGQDTAVAGGGPIESLIRLLTQENVSIDLDLPWVAKAIVVWVDVGLMAIMWMVTKILPRFDFFNTSTYVAYGFNISGDLLGQQVAITLTFCLVLSVIGYFFLKTREIAA